MFGHVAPRGAAHEQSLTIFKLARITVPGARSGGNREAGHGRAVANRTDFGISREVTHHSDNRFACHRYLLTLQLIVLQLEKLRITYLRRIFVRMTDSFRFSRRSSSSLVAGSAE